MKKIYILSSILLLIFTLSCDNDSRQFIEVPLRINFTIEFNQVLPFVQGRLTLPLTTFIDQNLSSNGIAKSNITSITAGIASLRDNFSANSLSFLDEISIRIASKSNASKEEIFFRTNIPFNIGPNIELFPSISEVKDILIEEEVEIELVFDYRSNIVTDFNGLLNFTYIIYYE